MQKWSETECIKTSVAGNVWLTAWLEPGDTTKPTITTFSNTIVDGTLEQNHQTRPFARRQHAFYDHTQPNLPTVPKLKPRTVTAEQGKHKHQYHPTT